MWITWLADIAVPVLTNGEAQSDRDFQQVDRHRAGGQSMREFGPRFHLDAAGNPGDLLNDLESCNTDTRHARCGNRCFIEFAEDLRLLVASPSLATTIPSG